MQLNPTKSQVAEVGWCMMVLYGMVWWYYMVGYGGIIRYGAVPVVVSYDMMWLYDMVWCGGMRPIWKTAHNNQVYWPIKQMCCCRKVMKIFYKKDPTLAIGLC